MALLAAAVVAEEKRGTQQGEFFAGVQHVSDGATKAVLGVTLRGGLSRYLTAYGDYAYSPQATYTSVFQGNNLNVSQNLMDYGLGLQVHPSLPRLTPYVLGGVGGVRAAAKSTLLGNTTEVSVNKFAYSLGAGARFHLTRYCGVSLEVRTIKALDISRMTRVTFGVFFQR